MKLITGLSDLTGSNAERRVNEVLALGQEATKTYALKNYTLNQNAHIKLFTDAQLKFAKEELKDIMYFFGYAENSLDPLPNPTGFYKFDAITDQEKHQDYFGFKKLNNETLELTSSLSKEQLSALKFNPLKETETVEVIDEAVLKMFYQPMANWTEKKLFGKSFTDCK